MCTGAAAHSHVTITQIFGWFDQLKEYEGMHLSVSRYVD